MYKYSYRLKKRLNVLIFVQFSTKNLKNNNYEYNN